MLSFLKSVQRNGSRRRCEQPGARSASWDHDEHTVVAGREEPVARVCHGGDVMANGKKGWLTLAPKKTQMDRLCAALPALLRPLGRFTVRHGSKDVCGVLWWAAPMLWSQQPRAYQACPVLILIGVMSMGGSDSHSF